MFQKSIVCTGLLALLSNTTAIATTPVPKFHVHATATIDGIALPEVNKQFECGQKLFVFQQEQEPHLRIEGLFTSYDDKVSRVMITVSKGSGEKILDQQTVASDWGTAAEYKIKTADGQQVELVWTLTRQP